MTKNKKRAAKMFTKRKKKPSTSKSLPSLISRTRRSMLVAITFVVVFAGIGAALLFISHAASVNTNDEIIQDYDINQTRAGVGKGPLQISTCLTQKARAWSQTMATTLGPRNPPTDMTLVHLRHDPNVLATLQSCAPTLQYEGQNIGYWGPCDGSATCTQSMYNAFTSATEISDCKLTGKSHYCNIIGDFTYMGVGSYRDDSGVLWITHEFVKCPGCGLATFKPTYWTLEGKVTASADYASRAQNIQVKRGWTISWFYNVTNYGPVNAVYNEHSNYYHYNKAGTLLSTGVQQSAVGHTAWGGVSVWTNNQKVPSDAPIGDRYCHRIWYDDATGPNTAAEVRPNPNATPPNNVACATVVQ